MTITVQVLATRILATGQEFLVAYTIEGAYKERWVSPLDVINLNLKVR